MQKRPTVTEAMIAQVMDPLATEQGIGDPSVLIDNYRYPTSGLEMVINLARREGWDYGCEIDDQLVDALDAVDMQVERLHREAVEAWFKENSISPPYPVGTRLTRGVIEGIAQHHIAAYHVKEWKTPLNEKRWLVVNFEDAALLQEKAPI